MFRRPPLRRGFTLLELLVVLAIVAISVGLATLALRDGDATRLEREGVRLAALLEMARAESRVSGTAVRWVPGGAAEGVVVAATQGAPNPSSATNTANAVNAANPAESSQPVGFRFLGLTGQTRLPSHWLDTGVIASVPPPGFVVLGPDAILPAQRIVLRLADQQIEIRSDGLGPFGIGAPPAGAAP